MPSSIRTPSSLLTQRAPHRPAAMRKRAALTILAALPALLSFHAASAAPPTNARDTAGVTPFLLGCDWPTGGSPAVKALFYETGCNFARLTGGGYGWALEAHRKALEELNGHGVRVLLQLGSHYPDSRFFAFKDSYLVDQKGETGTRASPWRRPWRARRTGSLPAFMT